MALILDMFSFDQFNMLHFAYVHPHLRTVIWGEIEGTTRSVE